MPKRTPRFYTTPKPTAHRVSLSGGYDSQWRKLRDRRIDAEPLCRHCTVKGLVTPAVEVDHIKPKALGGQDEWENTQSLCKPCHVEKTRNDVQRIRRGY
ncbi:HNH endonuclease signature motif containing protein [Sphingomonas sp. CCH5-D11]|uniref:HNH endonuclease n=1 Tax=Sphingomonas sp. CCH5-D11 TaxID=1768786 RepID=UPI0009E9F584